MTVTYVDCREIDIDYYIQYKKIEPNKLTAIARSILVLGIVDPFEIDEQNRLVRGHTRLKALAYSFSIKEINELKEWHEDSEEDKELLQRVLDFEQWGLGQGGKNMSYIRYLDYKIPCVTIEVVSDTQVFYDYALTNITGQHNFKSEAQDWVDLIEDGYSADQIATELGSNVDDMMFQIGTLDSQKVSLFEEPLPEIEASPVELSESSGSGSLPPREENETWTFLKSFGSSPKDALIRFLRICLDDYAES